MRAKRNPFNSDINDPIANIAVGFVVSKIFGKIYDKTIGNQCPYKKEIGKAKCSVIAQAIFSIAFFAIPRRGNTTTVFPDYAVRRGYLFAGGVLSAYCDHWYDKKWKKLYGKKKDLEYQIRMLKSRLAAIKHDEAIIPEESEYDTYFSGYANMGCIHPSNIGAEASKIRTLLPS